MSAPAPFIAPTNTQKVLILAMLVYGFALSQAFRTFPALIAEPLSKEFGLDAASIGLFAGAFPFSFGLMQLFAGVALDRWGSQKTVGTLFAATTLGSLLSYAATSFPMLLAGQILLGIGSSAAFLGGMVYISRNFPPAKFAALSGAVLGLGGVGMLMTGTPLAFVLKYGTWRHAFLIMAGLCVLAVIGFYFLRNIKNLDEADRHPTHHETLGESFKQCGRLLFLPQSAGIMLLGAVAYAAVISIRALWVVPLFTSRHGFSLIETGNLVAAFSVAMLFGPPLFGRLDPGGMKRRYLLIICTFIMAGLILLMGLGPLKSPLLDMGLTILIGLMSGYILLEYADVRSAYPPEMVGRALAVINMAMFLGVAVVQSYTGRIAAKAIESSNDPVLAVYSNLSLWLVIAALGFAFLPKPPGLKQKP